MDHQEDEKELSHFMLSRKVDEGFEIENHDVRIFLRRLSSTRAFFYICAPKNIRVKRISDNNSELPADGGCLTDETSRQSNNE
jgi:hypothetical protein